MLTRNHETGTTTTLTLSATCILLVGTYHFSQRPCKTLLRRRLLAHEEVQCHVQDFVEYIHDNKSKYGVVQKVQKGYYKIQNFQENKNHKISIAPDEPPVKILSTADRDLINSEVYCLDNHKMGLIVGVSSKRLRTYTVRPVETGYTRELRRDQIFTAKEVKEGLQNANDKVRWSCPQCSYFTEQDRVEGLRKYDCVSPVCIRNKNKDSVYCIDCNELWNFCCGIGRIRDTIARRRGFDRGCWPCKACSFDNQPEATTCISCQRPRRYPKAPKPKRNPRPLPSKSGDSVPKPDWTCPASKKKFDRLSMKQPRDKVQSGKPDWPCPSCTFVNNGCNDQCKMCVPHAHPFDPNAPNIPLDQLEPVPNPGWACPKCTFSNNNNISQCEMCNTKHP